MRSAAIGLIRVARRAGNHVASNAAAARTNGAIVKASGSYNGGFMFMIGALAIGAVCFAFLQPQVTRRQSAVLNVQV